MDRLGARRQPLYRRLFAALGQIEDGAILRGAFFLMLAGTLGVLYVDYTELGASNAAAAAVPAILPALPVSDPLRPFGPLGPSAPSGPAVTSGSEALRQPLSMTLKPGRVLELSGTIDNGAAVRFAAEVDAHGEYIDTVALNSPGGSVLDALSIGALIRAKRFSTSVGTAGLCASSCPLVFAGGVERVASRTAKIGVHQIYAASSPETGRLAGLSSTTAMADAQRTTALITRHLIDLGIDGAVWLHALETPPADLYYLSPEEMIAYRLATRLLETGPKPALTADAGPHGPSSAPAP